MQIKELSEKTGLSRDTIRFYEKTGLIRRPRRSANGYRVYGDKVVVQLKMISKAKDLGFSLKEIEGLANLLYSHDLTQEKMAEQLQAKLLEIDSKILGLKQLKQDVQEALDGLCEYKDYLQPGLAKLPS